MTPTKCTHDPKLYARSPIGMYHCPECGEMVVAGFEHPGILEPSDWDELRKLSAMLPEVDNECPF